MYTVCLCIHYMYTVHAPERIWKWGAQVRRETPEKNFCRALHLFWLYKYN